MAIDDFESVQQCKLLEGPLAFLAQLCLLALVILALLFKRHRERPRRPVYIWGLDVGKQGFSAAACHCANMFISLLASMNQNRTSQCAFYWVVYNVDQAVGTTTTIGIHKTFVWLARKLSERLESPNQAYQDERKGTWGIVDAISQCGVYGDPPDLRRWAIQVTEWVGSALLARCISGTFDLLMRDVFLIEVSVWIDEHFQGHPRILLFFVMVFYPLAVNIAMACVVDGILKWNSGGSKQGDTIDLLGSDGEKSAFLRMASQQQPLLSDYTLYSPCSETLDTNTSCSSEMLELCEGGSLTPLSPSRVSL